LCIKPKRLPSESSAFRPGSFGRFPLGPHVVGDDRQRCAAAGRDEIGRRPQHALPVSPGHLGAEVPQATTRHALEAVDELRERDGRRVGDEQVDVIVRARALYKLGPEVAAHLGEDAPKVADREVREHVAAVFRDEDQMCMKGVNDVPAPANVHVAAPETNL